MTQKCGRMAKETEGERSCPVEEILKSVKEEMAFDFNLEEQEGL